MSIHLRNEKTYIEVENTNSNVTIYMLKSGLLIQKDSSSTFMLRNGAYAAYFKYSDIATPTSSDINDLLDQLVDYVDELRTDLPAELLSSSMSMTQVRTNYQHTAVKLQQELAYANASSTYDPSAGGTYDLNITTDAGSRIVRQTREYIPATFVARVLTAMQATLHDGNSTDNVTSRAGVFEDNYDISVNSDSSGRGAFFEMEFSSGTMSVVARSNDGAGTQTDDKVAQSSWNIDPLDGTGISKYTLDPTTLTTYVVDWDPATSQIRLGVLAGEKVYFAHVFKNIDILNCPLRWELTQTDPSDGSSVPAATAVIVQGKGSVYHIADPKPTTKSADGGITKKVNNESGVTVPLLSLRLQSSANRAKLMIRHLQVLDTSSGGIGRWELVLNSTLTGAAFSAVTDSLAELSTTETDSTGGKVLASGFVTDNGVLDVDLSDSDLFATADIAGNPDVITLRVTNVSGVLELLGAIQWGEHE